MFFYHVAFPRSIRAKVRVEKQREINKLWGSCGSKSLSFNLFTRELLLKVSKSDQVRRTFGSFTVRYCWSEVGLLLVSHWNISAGQITINFCSGIHGSQRKNPTDFSSSISIKFTFLDFFRNISTTIEWIAMKSDRDIYDAQTTNFWMILVMSDILWNTEWNITKYRYRYSCSPEDKSYSLWLFL